MKIKIELETAELHKLLLTSLQHLNTYLYEYEFSLAYEPIDYELAKKKLQDANPHFEIYLEDILVELIYSPGLKLFDKFNRRFIVFDKDRVLAKIDLCNPFDIINMVNESGDYDYYTTVRFLNTILKG